MGFDMTSIYHYMSAGRKVENLRRFPFEYVAESNLAHWQALHSSGILPFLPNLATGWDDRPWHGYRGTEIYGRTVAHFERICRDAKSFADSSGVKRLTLAPINEWGEGSYAEPCAEFGFGMYEAVRNTFCKKPASGWPQNFVPADVGLGPYDLPLPKEDSSGKWEFTEGQTHAWRAIMGLTEYAATKDGLVMRSTTHDPAIMRSLVKLRAADVSKVVVRMKVKGATAGQWCQLFWEAGGRPTNEAASLKQPLRMDEGWHDYIFEVGQSRFWRGRIDALRFDPAVREGVTITISHIEILP